MASAIVPEVLRDGNYDSWSGCMKNYLLAHDLWDIIEGPNSTEAPSNNNEAVAEAEYKAWRRKNATALHAIQISCKPYIFREIGSTDSAKVAWDNLANSCRKSLKKSEGNARDIPTSATDSDSNFSDTKKKEEKKQEPLASSQSNGAGMHKDEYTQFAGLASSSYRGDWHSTRKFLDQHPGIINAKITSFGQTTLHIATLGGNVEIGRKLVELMSKEALTIQDLNGSTVLHYAARQGNVKMARFIVEKNETLVAIANKGQSIPIIDACANGHRDATVYLLSVTPFEVLSQHQNGFHGSLLLQHTITSKMLDISLEILYRCPSLATTVTADRYHGTALWAFLAASPDLFPSRCHLGFWQRLIYSCIPVRPLITSNCVRTHILYHGQHELKIIVKQVLGKMSRLCIYFLKFSGMKKIYDLKMNHAYSSRLLDCTCEHISKLDKHACDQIGLPGAFIKAVELGLVEFISAIVENHPSSVLTVDKNGRSMVMSSIVHRQEKVFNLFDGLKRRSFTFDKFGNTMLHLAGMLSPSTQLSPISGAALQMQRELQWYKEVENIITPAAKFYRNRLGETPGQIFSMAHKQLVIEGEQWMKSRATSYAVVGAFIVTIMFVAAFTAPGGNIQDTGINSVFLHKKGFMTFIISDAISLFASSTSVLMFLGILTARYAEQDFLISLPRKLIMGLSALLISIAAMMVAFCAALVVMLDGMMEVIVPIILLACIPVIVFMFLQFPLLVEIFMSTYGPGIFKRKMKRFASFCSFC